MIQRTKNIIKLPIFKALMKLALPIILANLFQSMYHLTDSFWLGRLGRAALAAVSISSPIIFVTFAIGLGFAIAGSTFVAQYFGAKNEKMLSRSAAQTILMILFIAFFFGTLGFIFAPQLLTLIGANSEIFNTSLQFIRISFIALIFNFSFFIFQAIMRAIGKPQVPVFIIVATVLLNFVLDPLFIFGWGIIPAAGVKGAALATITTQSLAAITGFLILFKGKHGIHLKLSDFKPDFKFIKKAFLLGLPSSIEHSSRNLAMTVMISIVAIFGTTAIASYGAAMNIIQVFMFIGVSLAIANGTLIGQNIGAKNIPQAVKVSKISAVLSFTILSTLGLIAFIFSKSFISFFIPSDTAVIELGSQFVKFVSLTFGFVALHMSFNHVFIASGQTHIPMFLTITSQWLIQIPLAYFLSQKTSLGLTGVYIAMSFTNVLIAAVAFILYRQGTWKNKRIIESEKIVSQAAEETLVEERTH